jgi:uncharacterized membrane protein
MPKPGTLDAFDKIGVVVVTILGTGLGLLTALASDIRLTPMFVVMFPGLAVGYVAAKLFGFTAGVVSTALANGAVYGLLLYAWDRLADRLQAYSER